jgi:hypothetical protein
MTILSRFLSQRVLQSLLASLCILGHSSNTLSTLKTLTHDNPILLSPTTCLAIPSCFTYWPRSVFARPFLHVRFCKPLMHTILVFVYQPQTAARHTQWRRYIHRHSFGSEQLDADDKTWAYDVRCFSRSVFARPFLHVRFWHPLYEHYIVFVYQPQTAARHTQWRRYIHRHSFGSEQLDADDKTYAPYLHVRFCSVPCITHSRQSYLAFSPNVSCNPFLIHCASLTTLQTLYPLCKQLQLPCITHSRQSHLAFSYNMSCNPFLLHLLT